MRDENPPIPTPLAGGIRQRLDVTEAGGPAVGTATGWARQHGWRVLVVAGALALATYPWDMWATVGGALAAVPVVVWAVVLASPRRSGSWIGLTLVAALALFVVPRAVALYGRGLPVPSAGDLYIVFPWVATAICVIGVAVEQRRVRRPGPQLARQAVRWGVGRKGAAGGLLAAALVVATGLDAWWILNEGQSRLFDGGLPPLPAGLAVAGEERDCGSHACVRVIDIVGDHAPDRVGAYLAAHGWRQHPGEDPCHTIGILVRHGTCVYLSQTSSTAVTIGVETWSIDTF